MRKPLAVRKAAHKPYKTLVQAPPIKGYIPLKFGFDILYDPLEEAILRFRQQRLAESVKTVTENIQAQDNSDLNIIELPAPQEIQAQTTCPRDIEGGPVLIYDHTEG